MSNERFKIPRASDKTVSDGFQKLCKRFEIPKMMVIAMTGININVNPMLDEANDDLNALLEHDSYLLERVLVQIQGLGINWYRGGHGNAEQKSPVYDELLIEFAENQPSSPSKVTRLAILAFLNDEFKRFEIGRISTAEASPEINQILAIHQSNLERLEQLNEELIKRSAEFRDDLERRFETKVSANEVQLAEKQSEMDAELRAKSEVLQKRETEVANKLAEIDDRDNTHVRREIRDRMLDDVKARIKDFGVSDRTASKRKPVLLGMLFLMFISIVFIMMTTLEIVKVESSGNSSTLLSAATRPLSSVSAPGASTPALAAVDTGSNSLYWLWGRLVVLTLSLFGTVIYYIKWQNRWADQHSASEFQLQQFYIDVNRANWVIESCLEWRKETESAIPAELLSSITNGLFVNAMNEPERVIHPADELASALMGSASKLNLKVGDGELVFDKPGKILQKTSSTAS